MPLRVAIFGQAAFGRDVLARLADAGHEIVGVHVPPDRGRPDPVAQEASQRGMPLFRHARYRRRGEAIPELVAEVRALAADLHVMPFTTVILPPEIVEAPRLGSLCFHPSLLPRYRGGSAIPWQIILGETETGVTVFRPDAGVDTGPIVVQRGGVRIADTDTAATLYFEKLYPLGIEAIVEAVEVVGAGAARAAPQDESRASFQGLVDDAVARIDWSRPAREIDRLIRGCDPQPGAHARLGDEAVRLFDSRLLPGPGAGPAGSVLGLAEGRLLLAAGDGRLAVGRVRRGEGKKVPAPEAGLAAGQRLT
jgi:methionyl-tRNA formyltransferase